MEGAKTYTLALDHPALASYDTYKGQCTCSPKNNTLHILIPSNCTYKLQPLDLSVNKAAKDFMRKSFKNGTVILFARNYIHDGICEEVNIRLSRTKPLSAKWVIEIGEYFTTRPEIILDGFSVAGILGFLV